MPLIPCSPQSNMSRPGKDFNQANQRRCRKICQWCESVRPAKTTGQRRSYMLSPLALQASPYVNTYCLRKYLSRAMSIYCFPGVLHT